MTNPDLVKELIDYFEFRGRFRSSEYVGMAASQRPALFLKFFDNLTNSAKPVLADVMIAAAVGRCDELQSYLFRTLALILTVTSTPCCKYFVSGLGSLEGEFTNPTNIRAWVEAVDAKDIPEGLASKHDWHYALTLKNVLANLGSECLQPTSDYLIANAKSEQFRRMLSTGP